MIERPIDDLLLSCLFAIIFLVSLKKRNLGPFVEGVGNQAWKVLVVSVDLLIVCIAKRSLSHLRKRGAYELWR